MKNILTITLQILNKLHLLNFFYKQSIQYKIIHIYKLFYINNVSLIYFIDNHIILKCYQND